MTETPPFSITPDRLSRVEQIGEAIGRAEAAGVSQDPRLRRINRIRTIRGSLAIEGNVLSEKQISTILGGDGPGKDSPRRSPPARVPQLMANLLTWLGSTGEHPLVASSVFHYEFEFIHPFEDGNGRMGRLWQTLILTRWKALFAHIPIESLIHTRQGNYYRAIRQSSAEGASTSFVAFMLETILDALRSPAAIDQASDQVSDQVARLIAALQGGPRTTAEIMAELGLSHRPTFRHNYIRPAIAAGVVEMTRPESPTAKNQKYRITARGRGIR